MDAFRAGLYVPPELAVFSAKRAIQGELTEPEVVRVLDAYQVVQVSFRRFTIGPTIQNYLDNNYWQVPDTEGRPHYIRKGAALNGFNREAALSGLTEMLDRVRQSSVEGGYAGLVDPITSLRYERFSTEEPISERAIAYGETDI
jgi:hypothetical protein